MSFLAEPFPDCVSFGAIGGPGFQTDVVIVDGGAEFRSDNWAQSRGQWEVAHAARLPRDYNPLIAHFRNAKGRANAFPFRDPIDNSTTGGLGIFEMITGSTYQLIKQYTSGSDTSDRIIYLPKEGTIDIDGGTVASISYTTGIVTMTSGTPLSWTGEFYVPCRYDIDQMKGDVIDKKGNGDLIIGWSSIPIVETRDYL